MASVLVVDDEENLVASLIYNLTREGYQVSSARDGPSAVETARQERPDLIILDVMLPGLSGFEVCRVLRKDMTVPILMLTAREDEVDRVVGLELGADDYVVKPFSMRELMARVRAMLRRVEMLQEKASNGEPLPTIQRGALRVNLSTHEVFLHDHILPLTPKEYDLLAFLMQHPNRVFTRGQLLDQVWGADHLGDMRTVDVHIRWLREKIEEDPSHPHHLETVRGVGYRFRAHEVME